MQSPTGTSGLKQVKVDNWGSFFLQRLLQLYFEKELLDLTIKFPTSDITVQIHRLVATTCTNYFCDLERQQKEKNADFDGTIIMPPDMPYECVKAIVSFMYTGQLEYWMSEQKALYRTAEKMKMTVLTKLLDTQFDSNSSQVSAKSNVQEVIANPHKSLNKKSSNSLPAHPLPGRKLPVWKRKLDGQNASTFTNYNVGYSQNSPVNVKKSQITEGPSRFDLPEADDLSLGVFSSFDDLSYDTKPIVQAPEKTFGHSTTSSSESYRKFDEARNDRNYNADSVIKMHDTDDVSSDDGDDWVGLKSILKQQEKQASPAKKVRFDFDEKENVNKSKIPTIADSVDSHTKIIKEVLKKYPHLVKSNKNIRLKIMQKEMKSPEQRSSNKTTVSYMVLKSDHLKDNAATENSKSDSNNYEPKNGEIGPWKCCRCHFAEEYTNYYLYRRHMQDVHEEKFDPRICEHCGYKATKRNILMYHLYTKHNVPPPKSISFPKCHACSYVALSESLLVRHQINQNHRSPLLKYEKIISEELLKSSKNVGTASELSEHEASTGHTATTNKGHRCSYCAKRFIRLVNLRIHIESVHRQQLTEEQSTELTQNLPVPPPLEPSSEAESLEHVASGIAASLGITDETTISDQQMEQTVLQSGEFTISQDGNLYNGEGIHGDQQMIMLIDGDMDYQQQIFTDNKNQQVQQLNVPYDGQLLMQGTDEGMIVYIENSNIPAGSNMELVEGTYDTIHNFNGNEAEQIVEEVVEEFYENQDVTQNDMQLQYEENYENVQAIEDECENGQQNIVSDNQSQVPDDSTVEQPEEVIQYIEETEIVEYQEEQYEEETIETHVQQDTTVVVDEE